MSIFPIDGVILFATSELPDILTQSRSKVGQKCHKMELWGEKMTSGNSEAAFFLGHGENWFFNACRIGVNLGLTTFVVGRWTRAWRHSSKFQMNKNLTDFYQA